MQRRRAARLRKHAGEPEHETVNFMVTGRALAPAIELPRFPGSRRIPPMPRTILLVEDNDLFRGMLSSMLELRGYTVVTARKGAEALELTATQVFDAVLTDVDMPEMDGFEFCARVRAQQKEWGRDIPVWIMTGVFRPALERKANAAGAVLVLRKPFPVEEVCRQLEQEFLKRESTPPHALPASEPPPPGA